MKYKEWLKVWLENYIKPTMKDKTFCRYREICEQHLIPKLGEYKLEELEPIVLQKFVTGLIHNGNIKTGDGLSVNSVNAIISVVQGSLRSAHNLGYSKVYYADKIKRPKSSSKQVNCFTTAEQKRIEDAVKNGKKVKMFGIILCLYTGLRIGELLALEWSDIDFVNGELTVSKTCHDGRGDNGKFCRITDLPKTDTSFRTIPLFKQILAILKTLKKKSKSKWVISDSDKALSVRSYQRSFERLLRRLGIPHKGFHALRHTFATRALECGMDVKTLSEILGHKNPNITLNRYVHSMPEHKKEMMNRLGKLL